MLGWLFPSIRREQAADRFRRALGKGRSFEEALAGLARLSPRDRAAALAVASRRLIFDEEEATARLALQQALADDPECVEALNGLLELATTAEERLALSERAAILAPQDVHARFRLAALLRDNGRVQEALAMLEPLRGEADGALQYAKALWAAGRAQEALELFREVAAYYQRHARELQTTSSFEEVRDHLEEANRCVAALVAELHGQEAVILDAAESRQLDASAGINYTLLAGPLMAQAARVATSLALESVEQAESRARQTLRRHPKDPAALTHLGVALLRCGQVAQARRCFERAHAADGAYFPALLGLGAALDHAHSGAARIEALLPHPLRDSRWLSILPDLPVLTDAEGRVVAASVTPLRFARARLAAAGACVRILPIDVRPTDLPPLRDVRGTRADDHRAYDAVQGVATEEVAVARIESLCDIETEGGWIFAHELAHLVYFHHEDTLDAPIQRLFARASALGYATDAYSLTEPHELFAVAYTDWLRERYGLRRLREPDESGLWPEIAALFDGLAARDDREEPALGGGD